jgi:hypothetical protein
MAACSDHGDKLRATATTTVSARRPAVSATTTPAKTEPYALLLPAARRTHIDPDAGFVGTLNWDGRCFSLGGTPIVWRPGYTAHRRPLRVLDPKGHIVGRVGDRVELGGSMQGVNPAFLALVQPPQLRDCISKSPLRGRDGQTVIWWL